ncbi:MAG: hypothetical protein MJH10_11900 [Epibacterium sp.]|nr:hypothetical protein [Epibacterium sp.]NQX74250.1 hypothetical protein [Epibacterium sp.]
MAAGKTEEDQILSNEAATIFVSPAAGAVYEEVQEVKPRRQHTVQDKNNLNTHDKIAYWGDNNDFPQQVLAEIEKNSDLGSMLDLQARALVSGGLGYRVIDMATGQEKPNQRVMEIEKFLYRNWAYPMKAATDFYRFINVWPQLSVGDNREKVLWLTCREAPYCRHELQDEKTGRIRHTFINSDWSGQTTDHRLTQKLPVIDPMYDLPEDVKARKDGPHYSYPLSYPTDRIYYQLANWNALRKSKWLELANKIPAYKLAVMKNQITIKYHIQIPEYYWEWKYEKTWAKLSAEERKTKKEEEIANINKYLRGEEQAGKSLVTPFKFDRHAHKEYPGIKIDAIDDKMKDGIYLEDSVEATIKMFSALGLDPSILGIVPGKGGSNRSGSDKREALNIYISLMQPHAQILLRPYDFTSWYNGWNNDSQLIEWYFKGPHLQTLDKVTPKERETLPSDSE